MKIGIFGGCFNPPHKMHFKIAEKLIMKKYLDKVIFVPTGNFYKKKNLIEGEKRVDMLKILTKSKRNLDVSLYEVQNISNTAKTLDYFKKIYPNDEIYFICGCDNLEELDTWNNYKYILDTYHILVIKRDGIDIDKLLDKYKSKNIIVTDIVEEDVSSTVIRKLIREKSLEVFKYIDKKIYKYIMQKELY